MIFDFLRSLFDNDTGGDHCCDDDESKQENNDSAIMNAAADFIEGCLLAVDVAPTVVLDLNVYVEGQFDHHPDLLHAAQQLESGPHIEDKRHPVNIDLHNHEAVDDVDDQR